MKSSSPASALKGPVSTAKDRELPPARKATMAVKIPWYNRPPFKYFFSLHIGISILILLTIASIYGTLIPELAEAQAKVYYSWWYKGLLLALALNMGCATCLNIVQRIVPLLKPRFQKAPGFYKTAKTSASVAYEGNAEGVAAAFRRKGYKTFVEGNFGFARRGFFSRFGAPISHAGLIIVLLGGFASSFVAKEGVVQQFEGGETNQLMLTVGGDEENEKYDLGFTVRIDDFDTDFFPQTRIPSHFISTVTFLEDGKAPRTENVEVNNSPVIDGWIFHQTSYQTYEQYTRYTLAVEHPDLAEPASIELSMGQSRSIPGLDGMEIGLHTGMPPNWYITKGGETIETGSLGAGSSSGHLMVTAEQFEPHFVIGPDGVATSRSEELENPALKVTLRDGTQVIASQWLFGREDMKAFSHSQGGAYAMDLSDIHKEGGKWHFNVAITQNSSGVPLGTVHFGVGDTRAIAVGATSSDEEEKPADEWNVTLAGTGPMYATVLSVTRNPAIHPIYFGCGLMMVGLLVAFFIRRKDVWFMVDPNAKQLSVAAVYRHPREELDPQTNSVVKHLSVTP
ncbi:cytochrome c biogenesis protein ResB [bacterium]|nr:cytochrome c biogenesis protein ResB [bacterium]